MALTAVVRFQGQNLCIMDIAAAAAGDTGEVRFAHGLTCDPGTYPLDVRLQTIINRDATTNPALSVTYIDATHVGVSKGLGGAGSAGGTPGVAGAAGVTPIGRLTVSRPHSNAR
jgi:hypothetical protein